MIGMLAGFGWKGALVGTLALVSLAGSGVTALQAHLAPDYAALVTAAGPVIPGSFRLVGEGDTAAGHLVIYTVARPNHPGSALGALLTRQPTPFARVTVEAGESTSTLGTGAVRYGVLREQDANLIYGVATGAISLTARTVDAGRQAVMIDPRGGFYLTVPLTDAGAVFTLNGG